MMMRQLQWSTRKRAGRIGRFFALVLDNSCVRFFHRAVGRSLTVYFSLDNFVLKDRTYISTH